MIEAAHVYYRRDSESERIKLGGFNGQRVHSIELTSKYLEIKMDSHLDGRVSRRIIPLYKIQNLILTEIKDQEEPELEESTKPYVISKRMKFDYGHRVMNHESKCITPHGHEGKVIAWARAEKLDDLGRVIDFSVLKTRLGSWIDLHWDHAFICNSLDTTLIDALNTVEDSSKPLYLLKEQNPTAENMAMHLLHEIGPKVMSGTGVEIFKIQFWETETSMAEAEL